MALYVNPVLSDRDYGLFRIGGPGLANCMFVAARAAIVSRKLGAVMLRPTWERIGVGQWIRRERDKRLYSGLFKGYDVVEGLRKIWLSHMQRHIHEEDAYTAESGIVDIMGLGSYFQDLFEDSALVRQYFKDNILPQAIANVPTGEHNVVAIHVRLGDFPAQYRTDLDWYVKVVELVAAKNTLSHQQKIWLFSDGSDEELKPLLHIPNVRRVYFGNALADIIAISRCRMLVGSDSTFSGWGAFLGNIPSVFAHVHYGRILDDDSRVLVSEDFTQISSWVSSNLIK